MWLSFHHMGASSQKPLFDDADGDISDLPVETVKVAIVGDEAVGKSQLFGRIVKNAFEFDYRPNKTVTFGVKGMQLSTHRFFWLELWDVPANPSLDSVLTDALHDVDGIMIVVDSNDPHANDAATKWIGLVSRYLPSRRVSLDDVANASPGPSIAKGPGSSSVSSSLSSSSSSSRQQQLPVPVMVAANKVDLVSAAGVTVKRHFRKAMKHLSDECVEQGILEEMFHEVSALDGKNVLKSARTIAVSALEHRRAQEHKAQRVPSLPRPDASGRWGAGAGGAAGAAAARRRSSAAAVAGDAESKGSAGDTVLNVNSR